LEKLQSSTDLYSIILQEINKYIMHNSANRRSRFRF